MASIVKRPSGYFVVFRIDGRQVWKKGGDRKKDALRLKTEIERELQQGTYQELPDITFRELASKWLELKKNEVRPKSYASYEPQVRRITAVFGGHKVKALKQEMVERFASQLLTEIGPDLTGRILTLFKAILTKGIQWGYLYRNPVEHVSKPKAPKREMDYLNPEELTKLLDATEERHRCLLTFATLTGCRQSEILGLRWGDVDFSAGKVYIRQVLQENCFYEPKTDKSKRVVVVPPVLIEALEVHQTRQAVELSENHHDLVFPNLVGKPMSGINLTRRVLYPALRRAGIRKVGFHILRHSYVSLLVNQGENIKFIQKQVGHSSAKVTWDVYSHLFPEGEKEAVLRLQDSLFGDKISESARQVN